jgi:hypothetical protein
MRIAMLARTILNWILIPATAMYITARLAAGIDYFGAHAWVAQSEFGWLYVIGLSASFLLITQCLYGVTGPVLQRRQIPQG